MPKGEANTRDVRQESFKPRATNLCAGKRGKDVRATKDEISELNSYMVQCRERGGERDV
jgi:hypothetical protein